MIHYYEVLVASSSYRGKKPLTYSSNSAALARGTIVDVSLRSDRVTGVVLKETKRPAFTTKEILEIRQLPPVPENSLKLISWMSDYYAAPLGLCTQQLLPNKLTNIQQDIVEKDFKINQSNLLKLSESQHKAVDSISQFPGTYLLRGETGSGKTRVYVELAIKAFHGGKSSMILTPEIGLTPQLSQVFMEVFGPDRVIVTHSRLTQKERKMLWTRVLCETKPIVIIGPRSALFMPLKNIGLLVVDESHEASYKQENAPRYDANRVAAKLAELYSARLVLGSATPNINDYYLAQRLKRPILYMPKLSHQQAQLVEPNTALVDLKDRARFSRSPNLSNELLDAIADTVRRKEQSLLFLNRRGTARIMLCKKCGWQATCPRCNLPMTFHADKYELNCHTCGLRQPAVSSCPVCRNTDIYLKGAGTKAIAEELARLFPKAVIKRFDTDNSKSDLIENHYNDLRAGKIDILIGTQLIAKGLDLPRLSLVGVVMADASLYFPDYSTDERTYQLLHQVTGRVGRGYLPSKVIVQSYQIDNPIIELSVGQNWSGFYDYELAERQKFAFPPFCFLLKLTCKLASSEKAEKAAAALKKSLLEAHDHIAIDGPTPSFREKQNNKYSWQLVVKSKNRNTLLKIIDTLPASWSHYIDPPDLL